MKEVITIDTKHRLDTGSLTLTIQTDTYNVLSPAVVVAVCDGGGGGGRQR